MNESLGSHALILFIGVLVGAMAMIIAMKLLPNIPL